MQTIPGSVGPHAKPSSASGSRRIAVLLSSFGLLVGLAACGQKGPLYLPKSAPAASTAAPAASAIPPQR